MATDCFADYITAAEELETTVPQETSEVTTYSSSSSATSFFSNLSSFFSSTYTSYSSTPTNSLPTDTTTYSSSSSADTTAYSSSSSTHTTTYSAFLPTNITIYSSSSPTHNTTFSSSSLTHTTTYTSSSPTHTTTYSSSPTHTTTYSSSSTTHKTNSYSSTPLHPTPTPSLSSTKPRFVPSWPFTLSNPTRTRSTTTHPSTLHQTLPRVTNLQSPSGVNSQFTPAFGVAFNPAEKAMARVDHVALQQPVEAPHSQSIGSTFILIGMIEIIVVLVTDARKLFTDMLYGLRNLRIAWNLAFSKIKEKYIEK